MLAIGYIMSPLVKEDMSQKETLRANRDPALASMAQAVRLLPDHAPASTTEYGFVRNHASAFKQVAAENPQLLPLLNAYLRTHEAPSRECPVRLMKQSLMALDMRPAAWRYVCRHGSGLFAPIWHMSRDAQVWKAVGLYLHALDRACLPPPPPAAIAYGWLRMFGETGNEYFRMDTSLESIPPAITRCVMYKAHAWRNNLSIERVNALLLALTWGEAEKRWPSKTARRAVWSWIERRAHNWETDMTRGIDDIDRAWDSRIPSFTSGNLTITPLRTPREMIEHARLMRNCLEMKIERCRMGMARYYAVWPEANAKRPLAHIGLGSDEQRQRWSVIFLQLE